jgi:hypothetical protein
MQTSKIQRGLSNQRDQGPPLHPGPIFYILGFSFRDWTSYFLCTPATLIYVIGVVKQGGLHGGHNVSPTNGPMCLTWAKASLHWTVKDLQLGSTHAVFLNLLQKVDSAILRWALNSLKKCWIRTPAAIMKHQRGGLGGVPEAGGTIKKGGGTCMSTGASRTWQTIWCGDKVWQQN